MIRTRGMPARAIVAAAILLLAAGLTPSAAAAPHRCLGEPATIVGTEGDEELEGTNGRDVIQGLGGRDVVRAGGGDDLVCGGGRADNLYGGPGDDRLDGGPGYVDDYLFGEDGRDVLGPGCSFEEGDLLDGGAGADRLRGSGCGHAEMIPGPGDDHIRATSGQILFPGADNGIVVDLTDGTARGEGRDSIEIDAEPGAAAYETTTIVGTPAADRLYGGPGTDSLDGGAGDDVVDGRGGDDFLNGNTGRDELAGGAGDDSFQVYDGTVAAGGRGSDRVICEPRFEQENASFDGGPGRDWVSSLLTPGEISVDLSQGTARCTYTYDSFPTPSTVVMDLSLDDVENVTADRATLTVVGSDGANAIAGSREGDRIDAGGGEDDVDAGSGPDEVRGGAGDDVLGGGRGNDRLFGDDGDDALSGDEGEDAADGGPGRDRCSAETRDACEDG